MTFIRFFLYAALLSLIACGGGGGGGGGSDTDDIAPTLELLFPPAGQTFLAPEGPMPGETDIVKLRGTVTDDGGDVSIEVNGEEKGSGLEWDIVADLVPGLNTLSIRARDAAGNSSSGIQTSFINDGAFLTHAGSIMFDAARDRLLVVDDLKESIAAFDLPGNYRKIFDFENQVSISGVAAYKPSENQVYFLYLPDDTLRRLDLDNGSVEVISDLTSDASGPVMNSVNGIAYDQANDRVYLIGYANTERQIISVNTANGGRSVVASNSVGTGPDFILIDAIAWDTALNRLLALDNGGISGNGKLYAVNVANGERTLLSQDGVLGNGPNFSSASSSSLVYDPTQDRALFVGFSNSQRHALFSINLDDGERAIVSDNIDRGTGPAIDRSGDGYSHIALDPSNQKAYMAVRYLYAPLEINLVNGNRRLMSSDVGDGPKLVTPQRGRFDRDRDRLLVTDKTLKALMSVDIRNGDRTVLSGNGEGLGPAFEEPVAVDINPESTTAYILDKSQDSIFEVDLQTGDRVLIFGPVTGPLDLIEPVDMVLEQSTGRLFIADFAADAIVEFAAGDVRNVAEDLASESAGGGPLAIEIDRLSGRAFIVVREIVSGESIDKIMEINLSSGAIGELIGIDEGLTFDDLAMGSEPRTLYALNNSLNSRVYKIDLNTRQVVMADNDTLHSFVQRNISTIETGVQDKTVYMFDALSGAVMLMEIDIMNLGGSPFSFKYKGVVLSQ